MTVTLTPKHQTRRDEIPKPASHWIETMRGIIPLRLCGHSSSESGD